MNVSIQALLRVDRKVDRFLTCGTNPVMLRKAFISAGEPLTRSTPFVRGTVPINTDRNVVFPVMMRHTCVGAAEGIMCVFQVKDIKIQTRRGEKDNTNWGIDI